MADEQGFPSVAAPIVQNNGLLTQTWYRLFVTLWNRTGAGGSGNGLPAGGAINQVLAKASPNDYDAIWVNPFNTASARAALSGGTGINYNPLSGLITNSAPAVTVTIANGGNMNITGAYPNFTIGTQGASGNFTTVDGKTVTVVDGIITSIV